MKTWAWEFWTPSIKIQDLDSNIPPSSPSWSSNSWRWAFVVLSLDDWTWIRHFRYNTLVQRFGNATFGFGHNHAEWTKGTSDLDATPIVHGGWNFQLSHNTGFSPDHSRSLTSICGWGIFRHSIPWYPCFGAWGPNIGPPGSLQLEVVIE